MTAGHPDVTSRVLCRTTMLITSSSVGPRPGSVELNARRRTSTASSLKTRRTFSGSPQHSSTWGRTCESRASSRRVERGEGPDHPRVARPGPDTVVDPARKRRHPALHRRPGRAAHLRRHAPASLTGEKSMPSRPRSTPPTTSSPPRPSVPAPRISKRSTNSARSVVERAPPGAAIRAVPSGPGRARTWVLDPSSAHVDGPVGEESGLMVQERARVGAKGAPVPRQR